MLLTELLSVLTDKKLIGGMKDQEITGVTYDPLRVRPGFVYIAINIYTQLDKIESPEGHEPERVQQAIANGAVAVVLQRDVAIPNAVLKVLVPNSRFALAMLANQFYGYPSRSMKLLGITGTNGKTTTTHIVESIFIQKYRIGLIGTLYYKIQGQINKSKDTTPEPPDLQEIFQRMVQQNLDYCVLEASSHGIDFHRLSGCQFETAAFTNLTQDHLDYHKTMENYLQTKLRLFQWLTAENHAVVNIDDPVGERFVRATQARVLTYGIDNKADLKAENIKLAIGGTQYTLNTPIGTIDINTKLVGRFNIYNALAAVGIAVSQGIDLLTIKTGLENKIRVSGRFELVDKGQDFSVVVDYAHTPDGMENVLRLAKDVQPRRIITVFGCGGDRDRDKRPQMGAIAEKYSDLVVVTADNPRTEDPMRIANDILAGMKNRNHEVVIDRQEAIEKAIAMARTGDLVMLLGKGHETTQTLKDRTIPFNDYEIAATTLENRRR